MASFKQLCSSQGLLDVEAVGALIKRMEERAARTVLSQMLT